MKDLTAHKEALAKRHLDVSQALEEEVKRPYPDSSAVADLKKQKLRLKDEISKLG